MGRRKGEKIMKIPAEFEDIFRGVELTERETLFLSWITSWDDYTIQNMRTVVEKVRSALSTLQAENEKLRAAVDNWKKKYVETNGKWIKAENKWAGLDKAVRNGNVYRPMQEELNLTHEENQSLKDENEKLRTELKSNVDLVFRQAKELDRRHLLLQEQEAELEQVKRELDICIKAVFGDCDYCKYDRSLPDDTSPCWHCKEYAAQEFVTGNYWQWRGPEEG